MANYGSLAEAIEAGLTNMTVIHSGRDDDGVYDFNLTDVDWFVFNSTTITKIKVSSNSFLAFTTNNSYVENLCVNRTDAQSEMLAGEIGMINRYKFIKIRWAGYSHYASSYFGNEDYAQRYDLFIFNNGTMYLHFFDVPLLNLSGNDYLLCNSIQTRFNIVANTPIDLIFTSADPITGTNWSVKEGIPVLNPFETHGEALWHFAYDSPITKILGSWTEGITEGVSSVTVKYSLDGVAFVPMTNGVTYQVETDSTDLYLKIELDTTDEYVDARITDFLLTVRSINDSRHLVLEMAPTERINNAVGLVTVTYDKTNGNLQGEDGEVENFTRQFTPVDILLKPNPMVTENVEIAGIQGTGTRTRVYYTDVYTSENVRIANITAIGTRTNVKDL